MWTRAMIRQFDPEYFTVKNFIDDKTINLYIDTEQDWAWGDGGDSIVPAEAFLAIENIYEYLGKRYKLSTAKLLVNNLDEASYDYHADNREEDNVEIPDVTFTVLIYLQDCPDGPLLVQDYVGNVDNITVKKGLAVFMNGDVLHRATNLEGKLHRKFLKFTFKGITE